MIYGTRSVPSNVRRGGSVYRNGRYWTSEEAANAGPKPTPHRDAAEAQRRRRRPAEAKRSVLEYLQST